MDTAKALLMGMQNRGKEMKVFDWDKAARIIAERNPERAAAGLRGDWEYTGGVIYEDGNPVFDDYTYLASTWATPELEIDDAIIECYVMEYDTEWDSDTKWPESALKILNDAT